MIMTKEKEVEFKKSRLLRVFAVILFLSNIAEIAVAMKMAVKIRPGNSGITFELIKIVWSIGDPYEWVTLPPLAPYDFEFHMTMSE